MKRQQSHIFTLLPPIRNCQKKQKRGEEIRSVLNWLQLTIPVFLIYTIGLLMVYDASSGEIVDLASQKNEFGPFVKQFLWGIVSVAASFCFYKIGWSVLLDKAYTIFIVLIFLLLLVFVPGVGVSANGARRWISLFGFSLQPSEFVKLFLPAFYLYYIRYKKEKIYSTFTEFIKMMGIFSLPIILIVLEPNNGTTGVIGLTLGLLLLITKIPLRFWFFPAFIGALAFFVFAAHSSYVQSRIQAYNNPELDIKGKGHQPYQAKIAAGSGGLFGRGPAKSMQKLSYLPEAQNDYIAAIYAEEFGFIGMCFLISMYSWLLLKMAKISLSISDPYAFAWSVCMLFLISLQTFMNLGVVSGLLPSTGLNLPFFSQGGSSLLANFCTIGILASMAPHNRPKEA